MKCTTLGRKELSLRRDTSLGSARFAVPRERVLGRVEHAAFSVTELSSEGASPRVLGLVLGKAKGFK